MKFDSYTSPEGFIEEDFRKIAETYFQNYLQPWCDANHIDDSIKDYIKNVLADYSVFFFDSVMHEFSDVDGTDIELKN